MSTVLCSEPVVAVRSGSKNDKIQPSGAVIFAISGAGTGKYIKNECSPSMETLANS